MDETIKKAIIQTTKRKDKHKFPPLHGSVELETLQTPAKDKNDPHFFVKEVGTIISWNELESVINEDGYINGSSTTENCPEGCNCQTEWGELTIEEVREMREADLRWQSVEQQKQQTKAQELYKARQNAKAALREANQED